MNSSPASGAGARQDGGAESLSGTSPCNKGAGKLSVHGLNFRVKDMWTDGDLAAGKTKQKLVQDTSVPKKVHVTIKAELKCEAIEDDEDEEEREREKERMFKALTMQLPGDNDLEADAGRVAEEETKRTVMLEEFLVAEVTSIADEGTAGKARVYGEKFKRKFASSKHRYG